MKAALISSNETARNFNWVINEQKQWVAEWYDIPNAERVAEVTSQPFDVAPPLFWVSCADDVVADQWYYDKVAQQTIQIIYPQKPTSSLQDTTATTTGTGGPNVIA
jgi:hypothetical protein